MIGAGTTDLIVRLWYPRLFGAAFTAKVEKMDRVFAAHGAANSVPIDGVAVALDVLAARGFVMGVATNDATEAAQASMLATGLSRNLPYVFGYDSVANAEAGARHGARLLRGSDGSSRAEVIVVGDNTHDLEMARSAGVGAGHRRHLRQQPC